MLSKLTRARSHADLAPGALSQVRRTARRRRLRPGFPSRRDWQIHNKDIFLVLHSFGSFTPAVPNDDGRSGRAKKREQGGCCVSGICQSQLAAVQQQGKKGEGLRRKRRLGYVYMSAALVISRGKIVVAAGRAGGIISFHFCFR